jgi:hypothetical protein
MKNLKLAVLRRLLRTGKRCRIVVRQLTEDSRGCKMCRTRYQRTTKALERGFLDGFRHNIA